MKKTIGIRLSQTEYYEVSVEDDTITLMSVIDGITKNYNVTEATKTTKSTKSTK